MKTKHTIIIWLLGYIVGIIGVLFKICHWFFSDYILGFAAAMEIVGFVAFVYKFYKYPAKKEFLNF
jgi:hypothetical protein